MSRKPPPKLLVVPVLTIENSYSRTACVLTGSPTQQLARVSSRGPAILERGLKAAKVAFQLPETELLFLGIYPATLEVVGSGTAAPTTTAGPPKTTRVTGGTASATPTATTTPSTSTETTSTSATPSTTTSRTTKNAAQRTAIPLILLAGAGAVAVAL
jgi:hypothetical protein